MIDLSTAVFTCRGSHLSVFAMHPGAYNGNRGKKVNKDTGRVTYDANLKPGIYFRNFSHCKEYDNNLFYLHTEGEEEGRCPAYCCKPHILDILEGQTQIAFASPGTMLIRTRKPAWITCERLRGSYGISEDVFYLRDDKLRYVIAIQAVEGSVKFELSDQVCIRMEAGAILRVDEAFEKLEHIEPVENFERCVQRQKEDFAAFRAGFPNALPGDEKLMATAEYLFWALMATARGYYRRDLMLVSKNYMCGQWSWDHCFAAMAFSFSHPDLAWDEFMCMFDEQQDNGKIADCIKADSIIWGYVKPPIHGLTLTFMQRYMELSEAQKKEAYRRLEAWTNWWLTKRSVKGSPFVSYSHGNDSGWDNATCFDGSGHIFSAELEGYLYCQMKTLQKLAAELGLKEEAADWEKQAKTLRDAILSILIVDGKPVARELENGACMGEHSLMPYLCVTMGEGLTEDVAEKIAEELASADFSTAYGTATEKLTSPHYTENGYWRGSIWAPVEFLLAYGFLEISRRDLAKREMEHFVACCRKGGFAENYNSCTGEGQRDQFFCWSASVYVIFTALLGSMEEV